MALAIALGTSIGVPPNVASEVHFFCARHRYATKSVIGEAVTAVINTYRADFPFALLLTSKNVL